MKTLSLKTLRIFSVVFGSKRSLTAGSIAPSWRGNPSFSVFLMAGRAYRDGGFFGAAPVAGVVAPPHATATTARKAAQRRRCMVVVSCRDPETLQRCGGRVGGEVVVEDAAVCG